MVSPVRHLDNNLDQWMRVPAYRQSSLAPDTKTYWVEDASCESLPAELFEPTFKGRRETNLRESEARFEQARKACSECPVWHLCYSKAEPSDFYYTMRAGIEPAQFTRYKEEGRVISLANNSEAYGDTCAKGHSNWRVWGKKRPRRKCVDCDKENGVNQRVKRSGKIEA